MSMSVNVSEFVNANVNVSTTATATATATAGPKTLSRSSTCPRHYHGLYLHHYRDYRQSSTT